MSSMNMMPLEHGPYEPGAPQQMEPAPFGLRDIWMGILRRARMIVGLFLGVSLLTGILFFMQPPLYTATAVLMISPSSQHVVNPQEALTENSPTSATVDSEIEVLRSARLAERLAVKLRLDKSPEWNPALAPPSPIAMAKSAVKAVLGLGKPAVAPTPGHVPQSVVNRVSKAIAVDRQALSYVINVYVTARKPAEAAQMANTLLDLYMQAGYEARVESGQRASAWLDSRLAELREDVQQKEAAAETFRAKNGLLSSEGHSLTEQQMTDVQGAVLTAKTDVADKEARRQQVQQLIASGGSPDSIASVLNSDVIRTLRDKEADLTRRQAELENRYGEQHPQVLNGRAELADIRSQIRLEVARISTNLTNEVDVARRRLQALQANLGSVRGELVTNNGAQVRLAALERDAAAARTVYESFLQRAHEISDQGNLDQTQARIVSSAAPPQSPSAPKLMIGLALAVGLGALAAGAAAMFAEAMDDGLNGADDVERRIGLPAITSVPLVAPSALRLLTPGERHPPGFLVEKPMSAFAEAFRVLRMHIVYSDLDSRKRVIAITSALPEEGKTTCALCLARTAAMAGQSVILVDCDLRRPALNDFLSIAPAAGLMQVLSGEKDLPAVVGEDEPTGAHILPLAPSGFTPRDVFGTEAMRSLIDVLRMRYDLVILDCAPVLAVADTRALATLVDATVLVSRWGKTPARAVNTAIEQLSSTGARILGVTLNRVDPRVPGRSSYSDALYYSRAQKNYYTA